MDIRICFVAEKEPDIISSIIQKRYDTEYSHILILFRYDKSDLEEKIFHAVGEGVCVEHLPSYLIDHKITHSYDVPLVTSHDFFLGYVRGSLGKDYSQAQIAAIALGAEADNDDERMICSELVGLVMTEQCGIHLEGDQDTWTPLDCKKALDKHFKKETP